MSKFLSLEVVHSELLEQLILSFAFDLQEFGFGLNVIWEIRFFEW